MPKQKTVKIITPNGKSNSKNNRSKLTIASFKFKKINDEMPNRITINIRKISEILIVNYLKLTNCSLRDYPPHIEVRHVQR